MKDVRDEEDADVLGIFFEIFLNILTYSFSVL